MPQHTQTISFTGYDDSSLQALAYGALESLSWNIKYAGEKRIIAYTHQQWNKYANEITVETTGGQLTVTSKMTHGEVADLMGRNKKFVATFLSAVEKTRSEATEQQIANWKNNIEELKTKTIVAAQEEAKEAAEVNKIMNRSKGGLFITYGIIAINVIVFIAMVVSGISILEPTGLDIIKWGANYTPLTLSGDWWRLISCVFVHVGIVHIAFNMYAFLMIGIYLEPMLGKTRYLAAYLCTGVFASLASLWWHSTPVPSAGASGAIFGMYGVFLALLSTSLIPKSVRNKLLQSIGIFILYNLVYGMKSGVDNSAHVGGLLSGLVIGYLYYFTIKTENAGKKNIVVVIITAATIAAAASYLKANTEKASVRNEIINELGEAKFKDSQKFLDKYNEFVEMQDRALAPLKDTTITTEQISKRLDEISTPEWDSAGVLAEEIKQYNVSDNYKKKADAMTKYVELRKQQIPLLKKALETNSDEINQQLGELNQKIDEAVEEMKGL